MAIHLCTSEECTTAIKNSHGACVNPSISYEGAVIAKYERNGYDDSDFYAIVWDAEKGATRHIEYATTRGWTYHNRAVVDATPEVIALAEIELAAVLARGAIADAEREASAPIKGRMVKATVTRGKDVGVSGIVMWHGVDQYRSTRYMTVYKVGIKVDGEDKLRYLAEDKATVVNPEKVDVASIIARAREHAKQHGWRTSL